MDMISIWLFVIFAALLVSWLYTETSKKHIAGIVLGLLCGLCFFAVKQRDAILEAQHRACMRLLGEALDDEDYERAKLAVSRYNNPDEPMHPAFRMLDVLTDKEKNRRLIQRQP